MTPCPQPVVIASDAAVTRSSENPVGWSGAARRRAEGIGEYRARHPVGVWAAKTVATGPPRPLPCTEHRSMPERVENANGISTDASRSGAVPGFTGSDMPEPPPVVADHPGEPAVAPKGAQVRGVVPVQLAATDPPVDEQHVDRPGSVMVRDLEPIDRRVERLDGHRHT